MSAPTTPAPHTPHAPDTHAPDASRSRQTVTAGLFPVWTAVRIRVMDAAALGLRTTASRAKQLMSGQRSADAEPRVSRTLARGVGIGAAIAVWVLSLSGVIAPPQDAHFLIKLGWIYWILLSMVGITVTATGLALECAAALPHRRKQR